MPPETIPPGTPSAFELGKLAGHVETMGREIGELRTSVDKRVERSEFSRAYRILVCFDLAIIAALAALALKAF